MVHHMGIKFQWTIYNLLVAVSIKNNYINQNIIQKLIFFIEI